ncbi:MAG: hypothetical protein Q4F41_01795 [Eubacteriales bacterium]|nr:hypothetical protein [Eubacteriales bacterium]
MVLLSSYFVGESPLVCCIKGDHERCGALAAEFMSYVLKKEQGARAVKMIYEYLIHGISQEEVMLTPILIMKSNYEYFL